MIRGFVKDDNEAVIRLSIRSEELIVEYFEAVIDTGFTGSLSLPPELIAKLGLEFSGQSHAELADGSDRVFDIYEGVVVWDDSERLIDVYEADAIPLVGMSLLSGYQLKIDVQHEGDVSIQRLVELSS